MEIKNILTADILDIIFEGRNKDYGAYDLRKKYNRRLYQSLVLTGSVCLLLISGYLVAGKNKGSNGAEIFVDDYVLEKAPPAKPEPEPIIPPPVKQPVPTQTKTIDFATIVIVKEADPSEIPPEIGEVENAKIALVTTDGTDETGIVPPISDGVAKGIVTAPTKSNEDKDKVFIKVEIESQYPGGASAWLRFLNKKLGNNYPTEAAEKGIEGRVVIQFIVDQEGNVSDVQAISGPEALHEAAVKVIKQSGQWIPAIQNGEKVKSYKKQPISFQLGTE